MECQKTAIASELKEILQHQRDAGWLKEDEVLESIRIWLKERTIVVPNIPMFLATFGAGIICGMFFASR